MMAIKIKQNGELERFLPINNKFGLVEIVSILGPDFFLEKFEHFYVIYTGETNDLELNVRASDFLKVRLYSTILLIPFEEMPHEIHEFSKISNDGNDFTNDEIKPTSNDIDAGIITAIQNSEIYNNLSKNIEKGYLSHKINFNKKMYLYNPKIVDITNENTQKLLYNAYDYLINSELNDLTLYEDEFYVIKIIVGEKNVFMTLNQILKILEDKSEYEKCAKIRDIIFELKK